MVRRLMNAVLEAELSLIYEKFECIGSFTRIYNGYSP